MLILLVLFALHTFLLMGTGTWSDLATAGEDYGLVLYYAREGMLAVGFLLYAAFAQWRKSRPLSPKVSNVASVVLVGLFVVCVLVSQVSTLPALRVPAVLAVALLVGVSGGLVYERIALSAWYRAGQAGVPARCSGDVVRMLAPVVGGGGTLAVVLQYMLQTGFSVGEWLGVFFVACFGVLMWLVRKAWSLSNEAQAFQEANPDDSDAEGARDVAVGHGSGSVGVAVIVCLVVATACLFALLPFYEALVRALGVGSSSFYEWYRLLLAVGYIVIGAATYVGGRRASSAVMLVSALLVVIVLVQAVLLGPGSFTTALFYYLLGAAIAWSSIAFMSVAARSACPAFAASMGRVLLVLITLAEIPVQIAGELPLLPALAVELALFAVALIAMMRGGFLDFASVSEVPELPEEKPTPSIEERVRLLGEECNLSDRELEVLSALVLTEKKNQTIATDLGISRRQMQTHVSRIYEKTGTTTRAGLVMRIYGDTQSR